jgi:hypothetical protein
VERGGSVRSFHPGSADKFTVTKIVRENIAKESRLHTHESNLYLGSDAHFVSHENGQTLSQGMGARQHLSPVKRNRDQSQRRIPPREFTVSRANSI